MSVNLVCGSRYARQDCSRRANFVTPNSPPPHEKCDSSCWYLKILRELLGGDAAIHDSNGQQGLVSLGSGGSLSLRPSVTRTIRVDLSLIPLCFFAKADQLIVS